MVQNVQGSQTWGVPLICPTPAIGRGGWGTRSVPITQLFRGFRPFLDGDGGGEVIITDQAKENSWLQAIFYIFRVCHFLKNT